MLVTVGTFAVRLAKAFGVRISGVAGTAKVDLSMRSAPDG